MRRMRRRWIGVAAMAGLALAGCSGGDDDDAPATTDQTRVGGDGAGGSSDQEDPGSGVVRAGGAGPAACGTNVGQVCNTGEDGVCAAGTLACIDGLERCVADTPPSAEACDGLDNDCNGEVDEGCSSLGEFCSSSCDGSICTSTSQTCADSDLSLPCVGTTAGMYCSRSCSTDADCENPNTPMKCLNDCTFTFGSSLVDRCYETRSADWIRANICD